MLFQRHTLKVARGQLKTPAQTRISITGREGRVLHWPEAKKPSMARWSSGCIWFAGARKINAGEGAYSDFIRAYTSEQYRLRTGETLSPTLLQESSDRIAEAVINDIITNGELPTINVLGQKDASQTAADVFNGDQGIWSGTSNW